MDSKTLSDCRVLLVDDTKANIDVLVETLRNDDELRTPIDGDRALRSVEQSPLNIILLDHMMPCLGENGCRDW